MPFEYPEVVVRLLQPALRLAIVDVFDYLHYFLLSFQALLAGIVREPPNPVLLLNALRRALLPILRRREMDDPLWEHYLLLLVSLGEPLVPHLVELHII